MEQKPIQHHESEQPVDAEQSLITFMRHRNIACPLCKYNLRNLTAPNCPECGAKLVLGVQQAEPYMMAWIVATVAMSMIAGLGILLLSAMVLEGRWPVHGSSIVQLAGAFTICAIPLAALLVACRRWLLRLDRKFQRVLACLAVAFAVFVIGVVVQN